MITHRTIEANGIQIHVATAGDGPPLLLLHGFPHTWLVWRDVMEALASTHRVIAPDLRGLGATTRADGGYDLDTLVADALAVLPGEPAVVVGLDLGAPIAFLTAARHPDRVRALVVMEALLGTLPGAEPFAAPWWFAFHAQPDLPEALLDGHEDAWVDHFLRIGARHPIAPDVRAALREAYRGPASVRCALAHYRALPENARLLAAAPRVRVPALAIAGGVVGDALLRQLAPRCELLATGRVDDAAHILPLDQPAAVARAIGSFASARR